MRSRFLPACATMITALLLAGCNPSQATSGSSNTPSGQAAPPPANTTTASAAAATLIPVGAGPQIHYTVQPQPPAGSCHYRSDKGEPLEDPTCTPGAISPAVTQANISTTICRKGGYTGGIRPPESVTGKEKVLNAKSYGYTGSMGDAEYDHLLSGVAAVMCGI